MESQAPFATATVVRNTALMLGCIILVGLGLRTLIAREIDPIAMSIGVFCALTLFAVGRQVSRGAPANSAAVAVMAIAITLYSALSWTSHGFRGSIIFAAPMLPLVASLMLGKRAARNVTIITAVILMFILTQHLVGTLQPDENFPEEIRYGMRAVILLLSLVAVNWISSYYTTLGVVSAEAGDGAADTRDRLTGLLRRSVIDEALARDFARARRAESCFSIAIAAVDNYSTLEAEYGPQGAENCLLGVADGLRYCMRRSSDAPGRWSHEQFLILMSDTPAPGALQAAEKFRALIESLDIAIDPDRMTRLTVSVGLCTVEARGLATVEALVAGAEAALAQAGDEGGNAVVVFEVPVTDNGAS